MTRLLLILATVSIIGQLTSAAPAKFSENIRKNWRLKEGQGAGPSRVTGHLAPRVYPEVEFPAKSGILPSPVAASAGEDTESRKKPKFTIKYRIAKTPPPSTTSEESSGSDISYDPTQSRRPVPRRKTLVNNRPQALAGPKAAASPSVTSRKRPSPSQKWMKSIPPKRIRATDKERRAKREDFLAAWEAQNLSTDLPPETLAERVFKWKPKRFSNDSIGIFTSAMIKEAKKDQAYYDTYIRHKRLLASRLRTSLTTRPPGRHIGRDITRQKQLDSKVRDVIKQFTKQNVNFEGSLEHIEQATRGKGLKDYTPANCTKHIMRHLSKKRGDAAVARFKRIRDEAWKNRANTRENIRKYWKVDSPKEELD